MTYGTDAARMVVGGISSRSCDSGPAVNGAAGGGGHSHWTRHGAYLWALGTEGGYSEHVLTSVAHTMTGHTVDELHWAFPIDIRISHSVTVKCIYHQRPKRLVGVPGMASKTRLMKKEAEADIERSESDKAEAEERKESAEMKKDVADIGEKVKKKLTR